MLAVLWLTRPSIWGFGERAVYLLRQGQKQGGGGVALLVPVRLIKDVTVPLEVTDLGAPPGRWEKSGRAQRGEGMMQIGPLLVTTTAKPIEGL